MVKRLRKVLVVLCVLLASYWIFLYSHYEVPILMYHSLDAAKIDTYSAVAPEVFYRQMESIKHWGYHVLSLADYCRLLKDGGKIPRNSVIITFDDGLIDNTAAAEILEEFDFPATFFLIANKLGTPGYLAADTVSEIIAQSRVSIGSHTLNEVYLPEAVPGVLEEEIAGSKIKLAEQFGRTIEIFSYTIGGFNEQIIDEVKAAGYVCACTTNRGFDRTLNRFALRRIKVTNRDTGIRLWAKLSGHYNIFKRPKNPY